MGYFLEAFCPGFNTISDSKAPKGIRAPFRQLYENEYANKTHFCGWKNFFLGHGLFGKDGEKVKMVHWEQLFCFDASRPRYMWRGAAVCSSVVH